MNTKNDKPEQQEQVPSQQQPTQPPGYFVPYPQYEEEDEINLLDLLIVLLKHKFLIIGIVFLSAIGSVIYAINLPNIYRSEATIIPREQEKTAVPSALAALGGLVESQAKC